MTQLCGAMNGSCGHGAPAVRSARRWGGLRAAVPSSGKRSVCWVFPGDRLPFSAGSGPCCGAERGNLSLAQFELPAPVLLGSECLVCCPDQWV